MAKPNQARWWVVVPLLVFAAGCGGERDPMDEATIAVLCENRVKDQLKAPSTADFPSLMRSVRYSSGRRVATLSSYVDAENSFGAKVRTNFTCRVERKETNDGWRVTATLQDKGGASTTIEAEPRNQF